ncbi:MAG: hypothetical protein HQK51_08145 [Oligoflexia bacterium]|nr:hypothetical protein [Oligoflexia bacterium]
MTEKTEQHTENSLSLSDHIKALLQIRSHHIIFYLVCAVLFFWCINSLYFNNYAIIPLTILPPENFKSMVAQIVALKILIIVFIALYKSMSQRLPIILVGSLCMVFLGQFFGFYNASYAFQKINISTVSLLFGMSIISIIIAETKFFDFLAGKLITNFGKNHFALVCVLSLSAYFFSLFINNITTMLLMIPLTLTLTDRLKLNNVPFLVAEIIASNLGGSSTMTGDFPNILISTKLQVPYMLFIEYLMPICLINLGVMLIYFYYKVDLGSKKTELNLDLNLNKGIGEIAERGIENSWALILSIVLLLSLIILFIVSPFDPGLITLIASFILFCFCGIKKEQLIKKIKYADIVFFTLLFVLIGGVEASGLLKTILSGISYLAFGNVFLKCLLLMWFACLFTMFFSSGLSTIMFLPMFMSLNIGSTEHFAIWALSLGVCAGSTGALDLATTGPITRTFSEKFYERKNDEVRETLEQQGKLLNFINYSKIGIPLMYFHLIVSTIYVIILFLVK